MVGLGFIILSLTALINWKIDYPICSKEICSQIAIGFLDRPWILWGAFFYGLAGILTTRLKKVFWLAVALSVGIMFHGLLLFYGYQISNTLCIKCLLFFLASTILTGIYIYKDISVPGQWAIKGIGNALLIVSLIMLALHVDARDSFIDEVNLAHASPTNKVDLTVAKPMKPMNTMETIELESTDSSGVIETAPDHKNFGPKLTVETQYNEAVELNIQQKPALFFAWWCPPCDFALQNIAKYNITDRPYLVACFNDGDQRDYIEKKLQKAGMKDAEYFIFQGTPPVNGVPVLVWWSNGTIQKSTAFETDLINKRLLGQAEIRIGTGSAAHNAALAAEAINGKSILPGTLFSFNEIVGPRTEKRGYQPARQIVSTPEGYDYADGIGGGICRTATALNKAVAAAGLQEVERHSHTLPVDYEEDIAVAWGGWDYKFRNTRPNPITIVCKTINEKLVVEIWGN